MNYLNRRTVFDPRFTAGMGRTANASMTNKVLIRRPKQSTEQGKWDYDLGAYIGTDYTELATPLARVQPNKDWRARSEFFGNDLTAFQAVRIDIPLAYIEWGDEVSGDERYIIPQDEIIVTRSFFPNLEMLTNYVFVVRNSLPSGNAHQFNLLCDANLRKKPNVAIT